MNQSTKECWVNGIIVAIKIFIVKKVLLQPKLWNMIKTTYKILHNEHPFNMYAIFSMYIVSSRVSSPLCWKEKVPRILISPPPLPQVKIFYRCYFQNLKTNSRSFGSLHFAKLSSATDINIENSLDLRKKIELLSSWIV